MRNTGSIRTVEYHKSFSIFIWKKICYQFNHRNKDLYPLIVNLLQHTPFYVINFLLVRIR